MEKKDNTFENYYNTLMTETPEEIKVREDIAALDAAYHESPVYKQYAEKKSELYETLNAEREKRHQNARAVRPSRGEPISVEEFVDIVKDNRKKRYKELPEAAKRVMKDFLALPTKIQREMGDLIHIAPDIGKMSEKNRVTTEKDIWELQAILAQTCEDFIKEKGLSDIYGIHFTTTDIGGYMDATTYVEGIEYDEASEMEVRKEIGWTCF